MQTNIVGEAFCLPFYCIRKPHDSRVVGWGFSDEQKS